MSTFIFDVLKDLQKKNKPFSEITFILPSKRAGLFLKNQLYKVSQQTIFAPQIISIEEFVQDIAQLTPISNTELLFEFYNSYLSMTDKENVESFESFSKWAQILLQDFNEIDRYLIPQEKIFNYLGEIQEVNHWYLEKEKTDFVKNYLKFWSKLHEYYNHFSKRLKAKNLGYQGLIFREAVVNLESYAQSNRENNYVFLGFNALNTAEETIIQYLLEHNTADIYWDIDTHFFNDLKHDAAWFLRQHKTNWNYFDTNPFNWITNHYAEDKSISIFGVPKNIGQSKHIGTLLKQLSEEDKSLKSTAVVLGDENLLIPVLNSLPSNIDALNITMGFPLKSIPLASLFESLFNLHKNPSKSFYYKEVINIISHPFIRPLFYGDATDYASVIIETIQTNNIIYLNEVRLKEIANKCHHIIDVLFTDWDVSIDKVLDNCGQLIVIIKNDLSKNKASNVLSLEYLFRFNSLFNELIRLNSAYNHIKDVSTLFTVYKELLSSETLDFQGEPLQGLQVMGMLESRVLDFETVIISSVNEGILPSGKSNNSFIPFDVKVENNLPTYKEKDAVYTYHFYRLLQRAKRVYILYNTEADVLTGGEKSRFITQLLLRNKHDINHCLITPQVPVIPPTLKAIDKTPELLNEIAAVANKGFSPSSLTNYIRNPIVFYYQKILKIKEHDEAEETVAANTLGTVVHNTLEDFYRPFIGTFLTVEKLQNLKSKISERVGYHFSNEYKEGDITSGKNLIIFEIAKRFVTNFLNLELEELRAGNDIKILSIETENSIVLDIPELNFPVKLTGKVDRVDEYNGVTRIIDYKTGQVTQANVEVVDWDAITTDYKKYSKSFQVLSYALLMQQSGEIKGAVEAGIFSFKNLSSGFLKFAKKEKSGNSAKKEVLITEETLKMFSEQLKKLIVEICDIETPFIEKEV